MKLQYNWKHAFVRSSTAQVVERYKAKFGKKDPAVSAVPPAAPASPAALAA